MVCRQGGRVFASQRGDGFPRSAQEPTSGLTPSLCRPRALSFLITFMAMGIGSVELRTLHVRAVINGGTSVLVAALLLVIPACAGSTDPRRRDAGLSSTSGSGAEIDAGSAGAAADAGAAGASSGRAGSGGQSAPDASSGDGSKTTACIAQVAIGDAHSCALKTDGTLWCWGANGDGQLGIGTTVTPNPLPVQVALLGADVVEVDAGMAHTCVRKRDGTVWCWGRNSSGQLGDGTADGDACRNAPCRSSPQQVKALGDKSSKIASGSLHTCVLTKDGAAFCWGGNSAGQLGDGTMSPANTSPVQVQTLSSDVVAIAAGGGHSCALKTDRTVWCWGRNVAGQIGNGTLDDKPSPAQVLGLSGEVAEVDVGDLRSCARRLDGTLWCWGSNNGGILGDGTFDGQACFSGDPCRPMPIQIAALGVAIAEIALGTSHTCARKNDASLWCWGRNTYGQLGDGTRDDSSLPVQVRALGSAVIEVATGAAHSCARKSDSTVWCWDLNRTGQLGDGTIGDEACRPDEPCKPSPVQVALSCP